MADERLRRQASELASEAKTEFLSRASHEMRTPLNAVIGFAQLLQLPHDTANAASVRVVAEYIHSAGKHLLALVNNYKLWLMPSACSRCWSMWSRMPSNRSAQAVGLQ